MGSTYADISALVNSFQENAILAAREQMIMAPNVRVFNGGAEMNPRKLYTYADAGRNNRRISRVIRPFTVGNFDTGWLPDAIHPDRHAGFHRLE
mgnify:CR=1 FL=1